jgi:uncharacterized metal-binding protein YceD (DUF177 family)
LTKYRIPFEGLKQGKHSFQFKLTEEFFDSFPFSQIEDAEIVADIELDKQTSMMVLHFALSGSMNTQCDRCGDEMQMPIDSNHRLIVKFGDEPGEYDDEILVIGHKEHEIDVSQFLYEFAHLGVPLKITHESEDDCNQEVLDKLDEMEEEEEEKTDPRWDKLRGIGKN